MLLVPSIYHKRHSTYIVSMKFMEPSILQELWRGFHFYWYTFLRIPGSKVIAPFPEMRQYNFKTCHGWITYEQEAWLDFHPMFITTQASQTLGWVLGK